MTADTQTEHLRLAAELAGLDVEVVLPAEHDIVAADLRLHYLDWGGDGPPIVFLHGGALTARTWDLVCLALRNDYRCLAVDQRGHGDSEWSPDLAYDTDDHVRDLTGFIDKLGLEKPVLVGQSLGGMNSLGYAGAGNAGKLSALVLVDMAPTVSDDGTQRIADFVLAPAELDSVDDFVERAHAFNPARDPRLLRRSLLHNLRQTPEGKWTWKYDRRQLSQETFERIKARLPALAAKLPEVTCPTLVVRGADSDVLSEAGAEGFAAALPNGRHVTIEHAGHTVQGDNPRGLAEALRAFIDHE